MPRKGKEGAVAADKHRNIIVLDTNVFFAAAEPYKIDDFAPYIPADFIVPPKVIWELDQKMQGSETRDRARAALNVLKRLMERGAARKAVSCGAGFTIRFGLSSQEEPHPGLDMNLADDRIVALCLHLASSEGDVKLATTDFALAAKASAVGITPIWLQRLAQETTPLTRRERAAFRLAWGRVQVADSCWAICRRGLLFLKNPLMVRITRGVRESGQPPEIAKILARFDALDSIWTDKTPLDTIIEQTLALAPPPRVNYAVSLVHEPPGYVLLGNSNRPSLRESAEEHALRIKAEEGQRKAWEDHDVDIILSWLEMVREYVLDQVGEDLE